MLDWAWYAYTMRRAYDDRLREAEASRLVRQARAGPKRPSRLRAWLRAWLQRPLRMLRAEWPGPLHSTMKEAATDSKAGGSLIL